MPIYDRFAKHYQSGPYTQFTRRVISEVFPRWLELLDFQPQTLLDLACGSGEFALAQAEAGLQVTGLDQSAVPGPWAGRSQGTWLETKLGAGRYDPLRSGPGIRLRHLLVR